ncbi:MAG: DUF1016 family protein [Kiritimatiellae bacterium]|nr:DUF1016 family protein [Kiritimatiellia bacterium]
MNETINKSYRSWITELKSRYRTVQIRAAISVNTAMLEFYWALGKDISERYSTTEIYGTQFFNQLSADLRSAIPDATGFSPQNLRYCQHFYELYSGIVNFPQLVGDSSAVEGRGTVSNLLAIPWGHHRFIIDKCGKDPQKALFYVRKTIENGWSRNTLLNWLSTDLYEREGRAQTNFVNTLPSPDSDLVQQLTKDPYIFNVQGISERYREAELKDTLVRNIEKLLLELGRGFAFLGREYIIATEETEQRIDMLFYLVPLHRYVVVEVKTGKFETSYLGQLAGYVALVNAKLNTVNDNPAIGLLICKERDATLVRYVLNEIDMPLGVSNYELSRVLPPEFKSELPSVEELETGIQGGLLR